MPVRVSIRAARGPLHPVNQAGTHREVHGNAKGASDNPSGVRSDETSYCDICRMQIGWDRLTSHVVEHCGADIGAADPRRPAVARQVDIVPTATGRPAVAQPAVPPVKKPKQPKKSKNAKNTEAGTIYCNVCKSDQDTKGIREHLDSQAHRNKAAKYHPGTGSARQETRAMC